MLDDVAWMRRRLLGWGAQNRRDFPWRVTHDPFNVLVAEVLLQRTRADAVVPVYRELFRRWPSARRLAHAQVRSVRAVIRPLGLGYRAPRLIALARQVVSIGCVPDESDQLLALSGVGRYVANATVAAAYSKRAPAVDAVSARVYRRFFGLRDERPASGDAPLWLVVERVTPRERAREWNWAVLDLAAKVCLPARPGCGSCPLNPRCSSAPAGSDFLGQ